jgi:GntR family transcriptional repressor for pyruvate dehydrogenase complex
MVKRGPINNDGDSGLGSAGNGGNPPPAAMSSLETLTQIGPVARSSVVDAVAERLRAEILAGRVAAGSRLPSERELSLALGVNRLTLRAALARLEALGLVTTRHGSGTVVASWRERAGLDMLATLLGSATEEDPTWVELLVSLLEMRRMLASEAVALAAERHTAEDIDEMRALAAEQVMRVTDPLAFARGDIAFVRAVAKAARNVGLELVLNTFSRFADEQPALVEKLYDNREEALAYYDVLIALIETKNGDGARTQVRTALELIDARWMRRHGITNKYRKRKKPSGD